MQKKSTLMYLALIVLCTSPALLYAQSPPLPDDLSQFVRKAIVDSINLRQRFNKAAPAVASYLAAGRQLPDNDMLRRLNDTAFRDFLAYVNNNFGSQQAKNLLNGFSVSKNKEAFNQYIDQKIKGFYSVLGAGSMNIPTRLGGFKNTFQGASYSTIVQDHSGYANPWVHEIKASDAVSFLQVPFQIQVTNLSDEYNAFSYNNFIKFGFDKAGYTNALQGRLSKYYDLRKYFSGDIDLLSYAKQHFESEMAAAVSGSAKNFLVDPTSFLLGKVNYEEMMKLDMQQLREKVLPRNMDQQLRDKLAGQQQFLLENSNVLSPLQKDSVNKLIADQASFLAEVESMLNNVAAVKKKLSVTDVDINKIAGLQQNINANLEEVMRNPSTISKAAGQLLPMSGLQKFFLHLSSLNAGSVGAHLSERSVSNLFLSGLQLSGLKNNKFFSGGLGKTRDGGSLKDAGLQQSIFNPSQFMQFLRLGKGELEKAHSHFSVLNANTSAVDNPRFNSFSLPRNTLVGTFSKSLKVRKTGILETEISKSASQFRNMDATADNVLAQKSALLSYAEDFWQTLSAGVRYMDDWQRIGLSHNAYVSYAGFGYHNPGNPYSNKGAMQYDLQLRKQVDGRNGMVQGRISRRSYNYSASSDTKWRNLQFSLDGRYRFSRHITANVRLNQYQMTKVSDAGKERLYVSRKAMADATTSYSVKGVPVRSSFSLGWQQFDNIYIQNGSSSDLLLVQLVQMVPLGTNLLSMNMLYNKELTGNQVIGDMLNAEMGVTYSVKKMISLSSSLTYLDNKLAARQLGIRQSVNANVFRKAALSFYIDWRKNLIQPVNPYLYSNLRGELSIHYLIN